MGETSSIILCVEAVLLSSKLEKIYKFPFDPSIGAIPRQLCTTMVFKRNSAGSIVS